MDTLIQRSSNSIAYRPRLAATACAMTAPKRSKRAPSAKPMTSQPQAPTWLKHRSPNTPKPMRKIIKSIRNLPRPTQSQWSMPSTPNSFKFRTRRLSKKGSSHCSRARTNTLAAKHRFRKAQTPIKVFWKRHIMRRISASWSIMASRCRIRIRPSWKALRTRTRMRSMTMHQFTPSTRLTRISSTWWWSNLLWSLKEKNPRQRRLKTQVRNTSAQHYCKTWSREVRLLTARKRQFLKGIRTAAPSSRRSWSLQPRLCRTCPIPKSATWSPAHQHQRCLISTKPAILSDWTQAVAKTVWSELFHPPELTLQYPPLTLTSSERTRSKTSRTSYCR